MRVELVNTTALLMQEIADKRVKRRSVAMTYALAIRSSEKTDFRAVNKAIIERWSVSGLDWIKKQAWSGKCFLDRKGDGEGR